MSKHEEVLEEIYSTPGEAGSFTSLSKIKRAAKDNKNKDLSCTQIRDWLKKKETYTKYRISRKNFKRNQIISPYIDAQWQGDLAEMGNLSAYNNGVRYLLVLIDVVSKHMWVEPLKSKHGPSVVKAFENIFARTSRRPEKLQTDDGKEFLYQGLQKFLKEQKIMFFTVKSDKKAAVAERAIRTLKEKIYRYLHEKYTKKYVDVLQDLVTSYNNTYHSTIRMTPNEVNESNEGEVLRTLYGHYWKPEMGRKYPRFKIGSYVRLNVTKGPFKKGYAGNWTEEVYIVDKTIRAEPYTLYKVKDWNGDEVEGSFYEYELQEVSPDTQGYWKVDKIIKTKTVRGKKKYFVSWVGYPASVNSWVDEKDIKKL
jgi:hypothetical protein